MVLSSLCLQGDNNIHTVCTCVVQASSARDPLARNLALNLHSIHPCCPLRNKVELDTMYYFYTHRAVRARCIIGTGRQRAHLQNSPSPRRRLLPRQYTDPTSPGSSV
mmetsp:Transcript_7439/g.15142  ORF Transcript_7439/g.15142 Transcript_7439/m.15142 type:complete len:107 (-) Transcript_7439:772-1092(-)